MANDTQQQDRTEQATPKRREDARKKGDVPRSRELIMTCVMITGASSLLMLAAPMGGDIMQGMTDGLAIERRQIFDAGYLPQAFAVMAVDAFLALVPLGIAMFLAVFAGAASIGGLSFSMSALAFKGERLSPMKGLKRIFSANSVNELVKAIAKFSLVAVAAVSWLWYRADDLLQLGRQPVRTAIVDALEICGVTLLLVSTTLIIITLFDVPFQLWNHSKKLKMTRQEVRDEHKDTEGRPEVKSRIRSLQQQIANRRMMEDVPDADVIITNPTRYAVALKYDDNAMRAPKVIAKGKDIVAANIRERAAEHNIPSFEAPPLARALYGSTKLGQEIPAGLYTVVAQVLAYIFQVRDLAKHAGHIQKPILPNIDESLYT